MRVFYRRDDAEPVTVKDALMVCFFGWLGGRLLCYGVKFIKEICK